MQGFGLSYEKPIWNKAKNLVLFKIKISNSHKNYLLK